jgi:hypothetical protein
MADDASATSARTLSTLAVFVVGAAVAVSLGVYGRTHDPTFQPISTFGFPSMISMKVGLGSVAAGLALFQLGSALRLFGRFGSGPPPLWLGKAHKASGALAVLVSLPVAYHCLWSLGFQSYDTRVLVHSLVGCVFYGAFVAKVMSLHIRRLPGWTLPVLGGLTFASIVLVWMTSALWYFTSGSGGY